MEPRVHCAGNVYWSDPLLWSRTRKSSRFSNFWTVLIILNDIWSVYFMGFYELKVRICANAQVQALFRIGRGTLPEVPDTLSLDARLFILKCLKVNPEERPTAAELLNHPFVRRPLPSVGSGGSGSASPLLRRWG